MSNINEIGLVPTLTQDDLKCLDQEGLALILGAFHQDSAPLQFQEGISQDTVRKVMEELDITPVWGRDGLVVYRFNLEGKVVVFGLAPDAEKDLIPADILERVWIGNSSIPMLLHNLLDWASGCRLVEEYPLLVPEDHPEEGCIGFLAPTHNRVWLIPADVVGKDLEANNVGDWAQVPHLIQSNQGRLELASRISNNKLQTNAEFKAQFEQLAQRTPQPQSITKRQQQAIIVDLLSGQLSDRYKTRYMPKKEAQ